MKKIKIRKIPIYGIYGNDDNIFPKRQLQDLTKIIGESNVKNVENCSHYLFVDQQSTFLNFIYFITISFLRIFILKLIIHLSISK